VQKCVEPDENGRRNAETVEGREQIIPSDRVLMRVGFQASSSKLVRKVWYRSYARGRVYCA